VLGQRETAVFVRLFVYLLIGTEMLQLLLPGQMASSLHLILIDGHTVYFRIGQSCDVARWCTDSASNILQFNISISIQALTANIYITSQTLIPRYTVNIYYI